ncbi:MAG: NADH-quinone oxidoreductase subunit C [Ardenticatenaceae bacterium]|nr:NADH-quinone oxidoreductase subunit C [Ardenticatenaceae bacterium]
MITTEEALTLARNIVHSWDWVTEVEQPEPNRLDVYLSRIEDLVPIVTALRVKRLGYLAAVTGLDLGVEAGRFEVLYHFCAAAAVITLRLRVGRGDTAVPTLTEIIPGAEPFERELSEMFGITITGLTAPPHLYLPDDWPAATYPLRKDFDARILAGGNGSGAGD